MRPPDTRREPALGAPAPDNPLLDQKEPPQGIRGVRQDEVTVRLHRAAVAAGWCDARRALERAWVSVDGSSGRLELVIADLRAAANLLEVGVDRRLARALDLLDSPTLGAVGRMRSLERAA